MRTTIAGLHAQMVQQKPGTPRGVVVLCHGFGAPGDDLVGLAPALCASHPALADVRFVFPAAPVSLGQLGWGEARAWWMIDMEAIQRLQHDPNALREFRKLEPEGMADARKALLALVKELADQTGLPMSKLVLGGFSQGSMLATDVALRLEEAPGGLAVLSGTLLLEDTWRAKAKARAALEIFQSHGRNDPVLPFTAAEWLSALFEEAGMRHEFVPFDGGHTIPVEVLKGLGDFLARRLA